MKPIAVVNVYANKADGVVYLGSHFAEEGPKGDVQYKEGSALGAIRAFCHLEREPENNAQGFYASADRMDQAQAEGIAEVMKEVNDWLLYYERDYGKVTTASDYLARVFNAINVTKIVVNVPSPHGYKGYEFSRDEMGDFRSFTDAMIRNTLKN